VVTLFLLLFLGLLLATLSEAAPVNKRLNIFFQISSHGMADVLDDSLLVNQDDMGYSLDSVVLVASGGGSEEMLNILVAVLLDVRLDFSRLLIDRNANDTDLAPPVRVLVDHLVVVLHRSLARWAPGGPEVQQHDRAVVLDGDLLVGVMIGHSSKRDHRGAHL